MKIKCLLWDFGDTLCDERFIWSSGPEWEAVYRLFDGGLADDWNTGRLDDADFSRKLSQYISMRPEDILAHMHERCGHIAFYDFAYAFFCSRSLPQAIVTVNPPLWSEVIVPLYLLHETADVIVTSWEEGMTHKGTLCAIAIERLLPQLAPEECLLIDNKLENIEAWQSKGGSGYLFTGDDQFKLDVSSGIDALAA